MLINKIILSNFKNFESVEVNLGKMNVIVGANAAGKSNFIEALSFVRDIKNYGIENAISLRGGIEYLRNLNQKENKPISIEIHFDYSYKNNLFHIEEEHNNALTLTSNLVYIIEISIKNEDKYEIVKEYMIFNSKINELMWGETEIINNPEKEKLLPNFQFTISSNEGNISFNTPAENDFELKLADGRSVEINKIQVQPFGHSFEVLVDFIKNIKKQNGENVYQTKSILEQFPNLMYNLFNYAVYDFDLKKAKQSSPITGKVELAENGENLAIVLKNILEDKEKTRQFSNFLSDILPYIKQMGVDKFYDKSLLFKVKESYQHAGNIPSFLLSDGTIAITAMVVALFFEHRNLAIFEEPEQGIHPALIAKIMEYFYEASQNKQIIITTHNPEILKHTKLQDLFLISRNAQGFATITKPIEQEMVQAFLKSELGIDQLFTQNLLDI